MSRLIECVPNFSEGRDSAVIDAITATIEASEGVSLLDVDPGFATHRTVVTFVGEPEPVLDAAVAYEIGKRFTEGSTLTVGDVAAGFIVLPDASE